VAEEFTKGTIGNIFGVTPKPPPPSQDAELNDVNTVGTWSETWYAAALARAGKNMPRLKFLFKVTFELESDALQYLTQIAGFSASDIQRDLTFTIRSIDKPKFDFEYEEVNMYNFRTKVLKKITHRDINMSFFDDTGNSALAFLEMYRRALQPMARMRMTTNRQSLDQDGFAFVNGNETIDTAYRGVMPSPGLGRPAPFNPLARIIIHQIYMDFGNDSPTNPQQRVKSNNFVFTNPRIMSYDMEDMDYEQGGSLHLYTLNFDFDTLYVDMEHALLRTGDTGLTPQHPSGDIMLGATPGGSGEISTAGERNPFLDVIARQGGRAVQETVSGVLNKKFGNTVAGKALGGAFYQLGGILGTATGRTLGGLGTTPAAAPTSSPPPVNDNSAGGSVTAQVPTGPGDGPYG
jgi:hypothetical protein